MREFRVDAVTGGQDALGETSVVLELGGVTGSGQGVSTDILEAAGHAYVRALSNAVRHRSAPAEAEVAAAPEPVSAPYGLASASPCWYPAASTLARGSAAMKSTPMAAALSASGAIV